MTNVAGGELQVERLKHYQRMLRQPEAEFEITDEVNSELTMKSRLWASLREWEDLRRDWMSAAFAEIDAEAIGVQVTQYLKVAVRAERGLPGK